MPCPARYHAVVADFDASSPYRSPLLDVPGAAANQEPVSVDCQGVAWHYGDPFAEQRAVSHGVLVDRSHRGIVRVSGPDAGQFLNNLLSQKLLDAPAGTRAAALDLDMQGHILHHADVTVAATNTDYYLDLPAEQADSLTAFLRRMVFWSQVTIEPTDLALVTVLGPGAAPDGAVWAAAYPWGGCPRIDAAVPRAELSSLAAGPLPLAGLMAFTAERVHALWPELPADLDARSIPHEVPAWIGRGDLPGAVHLDKGCYRGQETVARVENLGRAPRLLVLAHLDGSAPTQPAPGDPITAGGRAVGRVGTVVHDHELGPIALVLLKRSALGRPLASGEVALSVDEASVPRTENAQAGRRAIDALRAKPLISPTNSAPPKPRT
ncbi:YgfZ/GcvT domain-containing protein [uncultured Corynebacterium sp.]|uniref:CAF17-like 4Fe-4S cluster assembly/insertion protein YgfZ n=1 Tax=Corynebacterium uberis TaxID=2883169 RepID=UPI0037DD46F0